MLARGLTQIKVFEAVMSGLKHGAVRIDYGDGKVKTLGKGDPYFTLVVKDPAVISDLVRRSDLGFGEAYMDGRIEVEGSLDQVIRLVEENRAAITSGLGKRMGYRYQANVKRRQKAQIQSHYDLGNDFYRLWLDDTMTYTCAYFRSAKDTLERAQQQKIDHILRKLQLERGQRMVDIGCGWGSLVIQAAKRYGVRALGVTLSQEQFDYAREQAKREGVEQLAKFELKNYQDLTSDKEGYDRVVSVGFLEAVGRGNLRQYYKVLDHLLKPGGLSVLHTITQQAEAPTPAWIDKYIFPGGYIPSLREILYLLPEYGFRLLDAENLRAHYAKTCAEWLRRFDAKVEAVRALGYDERFIRMWRLYLASSSGTFRYGTNDLMQLVLTKGINNNLPLTREHLYK